MTTPLSATWIENADLLVLRTGVATWAFRGKR